MESDPKGARNAGGVVLYDPSQWTPMHKNVPLLDATATLSSESTRQHDVVPVMVVPRQQRAVTAAPSTAPSATASSNGALRPGAPIELFSRANCGLLINYFVCGLVQGIARALIYSYFRFYLRLSDRQQQSAFSLLGFGWCFTFVFGYISDCFPIVRRRRKPLMLLGHALLIGLELSVALSTTIEPYYKRGEVFNPDAPRQSYRFIIPLIVGSFGHATLSIATEAMMIEHAHRESEHARGRIQLRMYATRYTGELVSMLMVALFCNSEAYGGDFTFSIPATKLFGLLSVFSFLGIYATLYHVEEELTVGRRRLSSHLIAVWRFMEQRATWQITLFGVLHTFCYAYRFPQQETLYESWLSGDVLLRKLGLAGGSAMHALTFIVLQTDRFRNTSWRRLLVVTVVLSTAMNVAVAALFILDVVRSPTLYIVDLLAYGICNALVWIIRLLCVVEIVEPGYEATCYTIVTAIHNLGPPLATAAAAMVDKLTHTTREAIQDDTHEARRGVATSYGVMFVLRLVLGLALLVFLPNQKRATRELKRLGRPNLVVPIVLAVVFAVLYVVTWSVIVASTL
ncbi:hypothetical protein P43SY_007346 [Pythium insidiosum]|uniref:Transmembrane protein n=1 Tax=Pythium insidiosum TaxID=114742 RepID=A0AAD5LPC8_PYTIN|nr:hypothetical protein P43SY_007346 [Pythium insidiosum]KAJ0411550.1 hypothetical protein ATCC90586_001145 [Pythium insidiosum]